MRYLNSKILIVFLLFSLNFSSSYVPEDVTRCPEFSSCYGDFAEAAVYAFTPEDRSTLLTILHELDMHDKDKWRSVYEVSRYLRHYYKKDGVDEEKKDFIANFVAYTYLIFGLQGNPVAEHMCTMSKKTTDFLDKRKAEHLDINKEELKRYEELMINQFKRGKRPRSNWG